MLDTSLAVRRGPHGAPVRRTAAKSVSRAIAAWLVTWMTASGVAAQDPEACAPADVTSIEQHLRAVSLDLRGTVPTVDEYAYVEGLEELPAELIEMWMEDERFVQRVVRRHRELLWPNVQDQVLVKPLRSLGTAHHDTVYFIPKMAGAYRNTTHETKREPCADEPATFGAGGSIEYTVRDGMRIEGWVEVVPYWDPTTTVKVCAFDAQDEQVASDGTRCDLREGIGHPECGCGPNLMWCAGGPVGYKGSGVTDALAEDLERRIAAVIRNHEPYTALFTSRRAFANGPLTHFFTYLTEFPKRVAFLPLPFDREALPDIEPWEEDRYEEYELSEHHAGILTSPLYLLRFQTDRGRANRFFESFLCQPFYAPSGVFAVDDDEAAREPDLQRRTGCNSCHSTLEPAAAYWARWTERGSGFRDPEEQPLASCDTCADKHCARFCDPLQYLSDENVQHADQGPLRFVQEAVDDGRLPRCVAQKSLEWLLGRPLHEDESEWKGELADRFTEAGYDYRTIVRTIVLSETYRRVR